MPIPKRWSPFTRSALELVPNVAGIYELGYASGEIVYIGSGDSQHGVKGRLYYHKNHKPQSVKYFRYLRAGFLQSPIDMENHHCQLFVDKYGRLPRLQQRMPRGYSIW